MVSLPLIVSKCTRQLIRPDFYFAGFTSYFLLAHSASTSEDRVTQIRDLQKEGVLLPLLPAQIG